MQKSNAAASSVIAPANIGIDESKIEMTSSDDQVLIPMPENAPRMHVSKFMQWLGRTILKLGGWKIEGEFPNLPKLVLIGAPHSSNWDGLWAFSAILALRLDIRILGKDTLFNVPIMGSLLCKWGVVPIDRSVRNNIVAQTTELFRNSDKLWFGLAPEGTRKRVEHWKTGFWKIARSADVPILRMYFHYPDRIIGIGPLFYPSDDLNKDMAELRDWYRPWMGKNRGTV